MDTSELEKFTPAELIRIIFDHKNPEEQIAAINTLGSFKDQRSLNPLIHVMQNDPNLLVRIQAVYALAELGDHRAFKPSANIFTKEKTSPLLRAVLVNLLMSLNLKESIPLLIDAFQERKELHDCIILSIFDSFEYYSTKIPSKQIVYIKEFLESLFDEQVYKKSWSIGLILAKISALYGSLLGIKFLFYYKSMLKNFKNKNAQLLLLNIEAILADLKENYSLSQEMPDASLYAIIEKYQLNITPI